MNTYGRYVQSHSGSSQALSVTIPDTRALKEHEFASPLSHCVLQGNSGSSNASEYGTLIIWVIAWRLPAVTTSGVLNATCQRVATQAGHASEPSSRTYPALS